MKQVEVYTDGACSGNPGPGGWGAVLRYRFNGHWSRKPGTRSPMSGSRATQATRKTNAATSWPWHKVRHTEGDRDDERYISARQRVRYL